MKKTQTPKNKSFLSYHNTPFNMRRAAHYFSRFLFLCLFLTVIPNIGCYSSAEKADRGTTSRQIKVNRDGITIEARYDPKLDNLIPGYKILTVGLTNQGYDTLRLNPLKDRWVVIDAWGRSQRAIHSLRIKEPHIFGRLPDQLQQMVDYPVGVSVGYSETIDLFFPKSVDLNAFRSVSFYNAERKATYDVLNNLESPTHIPVHESAPESDPRFQPRGK